MRTQLQLLLNGSWLNFGLTTVHGGQNSECDGNSLKITFA